MASTEKRILVHGSSKLDPKVWTPEIAEKHVWEGLNGIDRAVNLLAIAYKMAPEGSAMSDLLGNAYCDLAGSFEELGRVFGLESEIPALCKE